MKWYMAAGVRATTSNIPKCIEIVVDRLKRKTACYLLQDTTSVFYWCLHFARLPLRMVFHYDGTSPCCYGTDGTWRVLVVRTRLQQQQESVRPRWPYDMRPSVRAEKYIRDASGWRKDVTDGNDNGTDGQTERQTDRRTDRVRRNMRPPPELGPHNKENCSLIKNCYQFCWFLSVYCFSRFTVFRLFRLLPRPSF